VRLTEKLSEERSSKWETDYGESNGHVTDNVTWYWKVNVMTQYA